MALENEVTLNNGVRMPILGIGERTLRRLGGGVGGGGSSEEFSSGEA